MLQRFFEQLPDVVRYLARVLGIHYGKVYSAIALIAVNE
jgi:hypothetical protein